MHPNRVNVEPFEVSKWGPFGWAPVRDTDPRDGEQTLAFLWSDPHVNIISHRRDEVEWAPEGPICERLYRHQTHTQALLVLAGEAVVAVAPPGSRLQEGEDLDQVRAFLLTARSCIVLHRGTWHWGPFPTRTEQVDLFNVQGRRYTEDNECALLGAWGAPLEIVVDEGGSSHVGAP